MSKDKRENKKKIVVGLSGGVDSSVALFLLQKSGWQTVGLSLRFFGRKNNKENAYIDSAQKICRKLNIPYYVLSVKGDFEKEVVSYFLGELKKNRTPNPCVICNRYLKFKKLFQWARKHSFKYIATGHYARKIFNPKTHQYALLRARDKNKDQTYFLSLLPQKWLKYIVFPLGDYTKKDVYSIAERQGLLSVVSKKESQDFCFLGGKSLSRFLEDTVRTFPGDIIDSQGRVVGQHRGLYFYTIGQRKGLGLSGGPYYVKGFNRKKNLLLVTKKKEDILKKEILLEKVHFISSRFPQSKIKVFAKTRYRQPMSSGTFFPLPQKRGRFVFDKPQYAITPGQFCVFYKNDVCLGSGVIV